MFKIGKISKKNKEIENIKVEDEVVPSGFINKKEIVLKQTNHKYGDKGIRNGRMFKYLSNNKAMYCDNGETFDI